MSSIAVQYEVADIQMAHRVILKTLWIQPADYSVGALVELVPVYLPAVSANSHVLFQPLFDSLIGQPFQVISQRAAGLSSSSQSDSAWNVANQGTSGYHDGDASEREGAAVLGDNSTSEGLV